MDDRFLATYGPWDLNAFAHALPECDATLLAVSVKTPRSGIVDLDRIGIVVRHLWDRILLAVPDAVGHRAMWSELWFLVPAPVPADLVQHLARISTPDVSDPDTEVWMAVSRAAHQPTGRLQLLDELACGLQKIEYRNAFPAAFCIRNGAILHRPA